MWVCSTGVGTVMRDPINNSNSLFISNTKFTIKNSADIFVPFFPGGVGMGIRLIIMIIIITTHSDIVKSVSKQSKATSS